MPDHEELQVYEAIEQRVPEAQTTVPEGNGSSEQRHAGPIDIQLLTADGDRYMHARQTKTCMRIRALPRSTCGRFSCVWWPSHSGSNTRTIITAAGAGGGPGIGGSDGPYLLYHRRARVLPEHFDVSVLQVVYHKFSDVPAAIGDVAAAIDFCVAHGAAGKESTSARDPPTIILVGWSMGCPAVIHT